MNRLAAVWRRLWTFRSVGRSFALRIFLKRHVKVEGVIGIGGSYLGARAVVELLKSPNYNALPKSTPDIYFAGNGISSDAVTEILTMIGDRDFSVNVISKSGTTTEPAIAFRIFKAALEKKYGAEGAKGRIYATFLTSPASTM